jgi:hypothetical protein
MINFYIQAAVRASFVLVLFPFSCFSQSAEKWITLPQEQWPTIALINHVYFKNGDRYIHPSFNYAGTAFLIDNGDDTLAVTAKHVLWVARNKKRNKVQINSELRRWIMKPKGNSPDSVVVDRLLNEDSTEVLEGPASTILERDWLIFTIRSKSPNIHPLKPRYTDVIPGETVYIVGNPYDESTTQILQTKILRKLGMDILIEQLPDKPMSGVSGSPVIDSNGFVIGVFSSTSTDAITGKDVYVATSTEYLKDLLDKKPNVNTSKKDYGELIFQTAMKKGAKKAINQYIELTKDPQNYYVYNLRSANRNGLSETGEKLLDLKRYQDAVDILAFNVSVNSAYFHNYNLLAKAWLLAGNKEQAIKNYKISTTKLNDSNENEAFKKLENLRVRE